MIDDKNELNTINIKDENGGKVGSHIQEENKINKIKEKIVIKK